MVLGYDVKEEAEEIKTELKNSRNQFILLDPLFFAFLLRVRFLAILTIIIKTSSI